MYGFVSSNSRRPRQQYRQSQQQQDSQQPPDCGRRKKSLYRRFLEFIQVAWTGVKFALDSDIAEHDSHPRYRPESLQSLSRLTRFSEAEIKRLYRGFKAECPSGVAQQETLCDIYAQFFPQGANAGHYAHYFFNSFDQERSGVINFEEYVRGLSVLSRGSLSEKLIWTFNLYDINGDGFITKEEMNQIVSSVYQLMGHATEPCHEEQLVQDRVERIFQKMDRNLDGVVSLDEFMDWCSQDENITSSMRAFDSVV